MHHSKPLALALASLSLAGSGTLQAQERHVLTGATAVIWNLAGEVRLEPGTGTGIVVEVTRGGSDGGRLEVRASGGQLRVRYPDDDIVYRGERTGRSSTTLNVRDDGTFGGIRRVRVRSSGSGLEAHADLRVLVPRGQRVEVNLGVGLVTVHNVDGDLRLSTHASSVRANGTQGMLTVNAGSGSVRVENGSGDLDVDTGSGSTSVRGFEGRAVRVNTGSGSVTLRDVKVQEVSIDIGSGRVVGETVSADRVSIESGSGGVDLELMVVPQDTDIDTGSGGVRLALPAGANADVDIETGSGGISSDFPVTMEEMRRRELRGRIGQGGPKIRISTGSGGARLVKR